MKRRQVLISTAALLAAAPLVRAQAPKFPTRPITLVVPFAPGGNIDVVARSIAPALQQQLGQNVIVDNRAGGGGVVGATMVANAPADGHTLLVTTPNAIVVLPVMTKTPYKPDAFVAIGSLSTTSLVIDVRANDTRFKDVAALLAYARANPGKLTAGHAGPGTTSHLALNQLADAARCQLTLVPYKGSAPALTDLMGGQIDMMVDQLTSSTPHLQSGALRALAVMSRERDPTIANVPTLRESGLADFEATTATGLLAPAATPKAVVDVLNAALAKVLADEQVKSRMLAVGSVAHGGPPKEFQQVLAREESNAQAMAKAGKLKLD
jgi:tripartite-type tricarboxylate transporter receptor subunit TctC